MIILMKALNFVKT